MATGLITADSSVVIPLVSPWHQEHAAILGAAGAVTRLPSHVILETMSSLSRMPHGLSTSISRVVELLESRFPDQPFALDGHDLTRLLSTMAVARLRGGQVYDAVVGYTAKLAGATLLSRDRRAERTYRALGVECELLA